MPKGKIHTVKETAEMTGMAMSQTMMKKMRDDLRSQTCLIIECQGRYLVGYNGFALRWTESYSDAWRTRDIETARMVADRFGGQIMLFNPVVRQLRKFEEGNHEEVSEGCSKEQAQDHGSPQPGNEKAVEGCPLGRSGLQGT